MQDPRLERLSQNLHHNRHATDSHSEIKEFSDCLKSLLKELDLSTTEPDQLKLAKKWDEFCHRFFRRYQQLTLEKFSAKT